MKEVPEEISQLTRWLVGFKPYEVPSTGIYFLCRAGRVVYVGQSRNIQQRVNDHIASKDFDYVFCTHVDPERLDEVEGYWIKKLEPEYNVNGTSRAGAALKGTKWPELPYWVDDQAKRLADNDARGCAPSVMSLKIGLRLKKRLVAAGVHTVAQLEQLSICELITIRGICVGRMAEIEAAIGKKFQHA